MIAASHAASCATVWLLLSACTEPVDLAWNPTAAAEYLDQRAVQWMSWPEAARAQNTSCISCHTALPYVLARGELSRALHERRPANPRRQLIEMVRKRVLLWDGLPPYYRDKWSASRGTESVLNALILADEDARQGHLSTATQTAFEHMWQLQQVEGAQNGSWPWIRFDAEPWEAADSGYYGAVLAALAVGVAPDRYRFRPEVQAQLSALRNFLLRAFGEQTLLNRIELLWAAGQWPELVTPAMRDGVLNEVWSLQRADGGWTLASLIPNWKRRDGTVPAAASDGLATGMIALVLQQSGIARTDVRLRRAITWLTRNQSVWNGRWSAESPNRRHGWRDATRHFMDDAATSFAVLALIQAQEPRPT